MLQQMQVKDQGTRLCHEVGGCQGDCIECNFYAQDRPGYGTDDGFVTAVWCNEKGRLVLRRTNSPDFEF